MEERGEGYGESLRRELERQEAGTSGERASAEVRAASRRRHADLSPAEAVAVLERWHRELPGEGASERLVRGLVREAGTRLVDRSAAVFEGQGGDERLLLSSVPLVSAVGDGTARPTDLRLREEGDGFVSRNPLVELSADERGRARIGEAGLVVRPVLGSEAAPGRLVDGGLVVPEASRDVDAVVAGSPGGAVFGWQVRSVEAPERFELQVGLPEGWEMRERRQAGRVVGIEFVVETVEGDEDEWRVVGTVSPVIAVDADGHPVEASLALVGDSRIAARLEHREADVRYPIAVDPVIDVRNGEDIDCEAASPTNCPEGKEEREFLRSGDWRTCGPAGTFDDTGDARWNWVPVDGGPPGPPNQVRTAAVDPTGKCKLRATLQYVPRDGFAEWVFQAPGIAPAAQGDRQTAKDGRSWVEWVRAQGQIAFSWNTRTYIGIWSPEPSPVFPPNAHWEAANYWGTPHTAYDQWAGRVAFQSDPSQAQAGKQKGNLAVVGVISILPPGSSISTVFGLTEWHTIRTVLNDRKAPINVTSTFLDSEGQELEREASEWVRRATGRVRASARDEGLGLKSFSAYGRLSGNPTAGPGREFPEVPGTAGWAQVRASECAGDSTKNKRCLIDGDSDDLDAFPKWTFEHSGSVAPPSGDRRFPFDTDWIDEGRQIYGVEARDILTNEQYESADEGGLMLFVDRSPPELDFSGSIAEAADEGTVLDGGAQELRVSAVDGEGEDGGVRSGVSELLVGIRDSEGEVVLDRRWECDERSDGLPGCAMRMERSVGIGEGELEDGVYEVRVVARDDVWQRLEGPERAEHETSETFSFVIDSTPPSVSVEHTRLRGLSNLLGEWSFEDGVGDWRSSPTNVTMEPLGTSPGFRTHGRSSLRAAGQATAAGAAALVTSGPVVPGSGVPVSGGGTYTFGIDARLDELPAQGVFPSIVWFNGQGAYQGQANGARVREGGRQRLVVGGVAPAAATQAVVGVATGNVMAAGERIEMHLDAAALVSGEATATTLPDGLPSLIGNPVFEDDHEGWFARPGSGGQVQFFDRVADERAESGWALRFQGRANSSGGQPLVGSKADLGPSLFEGWPVKASKRYAFAIDLAVEQAPVGGLLPVIAWLGPNGAMVPGGLTVGTGRAGEFEGRLSVGGVAPAGAEQAMVYVAAGATQPAGRTYAWRTRQARLVAGEGLWAERADAVSTLGGEDGSSGIKRFEVRFPAGEPVVAERDCDAAEGPEECLRADFEPVTYDAGERFPEHGDHRVYGLVDDGAGNRARLDWEVRVDRRMPEVTLDGSLVDGEGRQLLVHAADGSERDTQSGVRRIEVFVGEPGVEPDFAGSPTAVLFDEPCVGGNCRAEVGWLVPDQVEVGARWFRVRVTDGAGNVRDVDFQRPVLDLAGPDPASRLGLERFWHYWDLEAGPGARAFVNADTGNLVWHSVPQVSPGRGLSSVVNLTYNSQERGSVLGTLLGIDPLAPLGGGGALTGVPYDTAGRGFSIAVSGPARVNEPLGGVVLADALDEVEVPGLVGRGSGFLIDLDQVSLPGLDPLLGKAITLTDADGTVHRFTRWDEDGSKWVSPPGVNLELLRTERTSGMDPYGDVFWELVRPDGVRYRFNALGEQVETLDRNLNRLVYEYEFVDLLTGQASPQPGGLGCIPAGLIASLNQPLGDIQGLAADLLDIELPSAGPGALSVAGLLCTRRLVRVLDPAYDEQDHPERVVELTYTERPPISDPQNPDLISTILDDLQGILATLTSGATLEDLLIEVADLAADSPYSLGELLHPGRIATVTDHAGRVLSLSYEGPYLSEVFEADNASELGSVPAAGGQQAPQAPRVTRFEYEQTPEALFAPRRLTDVVEIEADGESERARTSFSYQPREPSGDPLADPEPGVVSEVTSRQDNTTSFSFSRSGDPVRFMEHVSPRAFLPGQSTAEHTSRAVVDGRGQPIELTDPLGTRTRLVWDGDANVRRLVEAAGSEDERITDLAYLQAPDGRPTSGTGLLAETRTYPHGVGGEPRITSFDYAASGGRDPQGASLPGEHVQDLVEIAAPGDATTSFQLASDGSGNVIARIDPEGGRAQAAYGPGGVISAEADEMGNLTRYLAHHPSGEPERVIDPRGNQTVNPHAGLAPQLSGQQGDMAHAWDYRYDEVGNVVSVTDPRIGDPMLRPPLGQAPQAPLAFTTRLAYDAYDRLVAEETPKDTPAGDPGAWEHVTRERGYDRNDNLAFERDATGAIAAYEHTMMDRVLRADLPGSPDEAGEATREVTCFGYDPEDEVSVRIDPRGTAGALGQDCEIDAPARPFASEWRRDRAGRVVAEVRHSPGRPDYERLITSYAYDRRDNVVGIIDPRRNADPNLNGSYGDARSVTEAIAAAGRRADQRLHQVYNRDDELIEEIERDTTGGQVRLQITRHTYDGRGNRIKTLWPRQFRDRPEGFEGEVASTYTYDRADRLVSAEDPLGRIEHTTRRADGRPVAITSPRGVEDGRTSPHPDGVQAFRYFTSRITYDRSGEVASRTVPYAPGQYGRSDQEFASWQQTFERDPVGNPTRVTTPRGAEVANTFYAAGELKTTSRPNWWELEWGEGQQTPQAGERFTGGEDQADVLVPEGGPQLSLRELSPRNLEGPDDEFEAPEIGVEGNFGSVENEQLPDMLPDAGQVSFAYDDEMRLTAVGDVEGQERRITYDQAGRIARKSWPFRGGDRIAHRFAYDPHGNLTAHQLPEAHGGEQDMVSFAYDGFDRRVREIAPGAAAQALTAPGQGEAPVLEETKLGYDPNGNVVERITPRELAGEQGHRFAYAYDSVDRLAREENPAGEAWTHAYDAAGNRTSQRGPRGNAASGAEAARFDERFSYDAADQLVEIEGPQDSGARRHATRLAYDRDGNRRLIDAPGTDSGRQITRLTYDGRGLLWKTRLGTGEETRVTLTEYDQVGGLRRQVNPKGVGEDELPLRADEHDSHYGTAPEENLAEAVLHATVFQRDEDDLLSARRHPKGGDDARLVVQQWQRDSRGRVSGVIAPHRVDEAGDPTAKALRTTYELYETGWVREASDRRLQDPGTVAPIASTDLSYAFDERGRMTSWETKTPGSPRGRRQLRTYFPNGQVRTRTAVRVQEDGDRELRRYSYGYNPNRSLVQVRDMEDTRTDADRLTRITRDAAERETLVRETWTEGQDTAFTYDEAGNVVERRTEGTASAGGTYAGGRTHSFEFDRLDREVQMEVTGVGAAREVTTAWWPSGQRRSRRKANGTVERWSYDRFGQAQRHTRERGGAPAGELAKDQAYAYDENGNRTRDERGRYRHNARDQLVWWQRSGRFSSSDPARDSAGSVVEWDLDAQGQVTRETDWFRPPGQTEAKTTDFTYRGERLARTVQRVAVSQGTVVDTTEFAYDELGSTTMATRTRELPPGVTDPPAPSAKPVPEAEGCPELSGTPGPGVTVWCFDGFERLTGSRGEGADEPAVYEYDALDRRLEKTSRDGQAERTARFTYIGTSMSLTRERETWSGGRDRRFDRTSGGEPLGVQTDGGAVRPYSLDPQGSIEGLEDEQGQIGAADRYAYSPYGQLENAGEGEQDLSQSARENPLRFQGFYYDSGIKTYDMHARTYRPQTARFLTQDRYASPAADRTLISDPLTQNRYAFLGGNPVSHVEFDGHRPGCGPRSCDEHRAADYRALERAPRAHREEYHRNNARYGVDSRAGYRAWQARGRPRVAAAPPPVRTRSVPPPLAPTALTPQQILNSVARSDLTEGHVGGLGGSLLAGGAAGLRHGANQQVESARRQRLSAYRRVQIWRDPLDPARFITFDEREDRSLARGKARLREAQEAIMDAKVLRGLGKALGLSAVGLEVYLNEQAGYDPLENTLRTGGAVAVGGGLAALGGSVCSAPCAAGGGAAGGMIGHAGGGAAHRIGKAVFSAARELTRGRSPFDLEPNWRR